MEFLLDYWALLLLVLLIIGIGLVILLKTRKNETARKDWFKTVRLGDCCSVVSIDNTVYNNVEITEMDDEFITIEVKVRKRWIYPPKK